MLISCILAWITTILMLIAALRYVARISRSPKLNRSFHKTHALIGVLPLGFGLLHGIAAGNPASATLLTMQAAPLLFTLNWGSACLAAILLLGLSCLLRRRLRRAFLPVHRVLTLLLLACLVLHLIDVGITLPSRLFASDAPTASAVPTASAAETAEPAEQTDEPAETAAAQTPLVTFSGAVLQDGSYQGSAQGYRGSIQVSVTVEGGAVSAVTVLSENDTQEYFSRASALLNTIVDEQSLELDAVSGATYSSAGILNAVADALSSAVLSGELAVTAIDLSQVQQHGRH